MKMSETAHFSKHHLIERTTVTAHPHPAKSPHRRSLITWADRPLTDRSFFTRAVHYLLRVLLITISEFNKNEISLRSSALTYTILLSLVPMLALSTAVVKELGGGDQLRKAAYMYLATLEQSHSFKTTDSVDHIAPWSTRNQKRKPTSRATFAQRSIRCLIMSTRPILPPSAPLVLSVS